MATYTVDELPKGKSGADQNDEGKVTLNGQRRFNIFATVAGVDGETVRQDTQQQGLLPVNGQPHPSNPGQVCRNVSVDQQTALHYIATATYKSVEFDPENDEQALPWEQAATVDYQTVVSQAETDEDYDGNLIANPGTNEPVPGIMRRVSDLQVVLKRAFINFNPAALAAFKDKTNSDSFLGFEPGTGLVQRITANSNRYEGELYYDVVVEILFREAFRTTADKAWHHRRIIKGFLEVVQDNGVDVVQAVHQDGVLARTPILLDSSGQKIPEGGSPEFEETKLYGSIAYSNMGFDV